MCDGSTNVCEICSVFAPFFRKIKECSVLLSSSRVSTRLDRQFQQRSGGDGVDCCSTDGLFFSLFFFFAPIMLVFEVYVASLVALRIAGVSRHANV